MKTGDRVRLTEAVDDTNLEVGACYDVYDVMYDGSIVYLKDGYGVYKVPSSHVQLA